jgi:hypothetical protein
MSKSKTKLTADHLIKDYRELERKLGKMPTCVQYAKKCHSISSLVNVLGKPGWGTLLDAVGAKPDLRFSRESAISCYNGLKAELGRVPRKEFVEKCCSSATLRSLFGGSGWSDLLKFVGDYHLPRSYRLKGPSKTQLVNAFCSIRKQLGKAPNSGQYRKLTGYSTKDLKFRFGANAWKELLKRAKNRMRPNPSYLTAEHLIQDFLKLQEALGRRPSISDYLFQCHTPKVLDRVFGKPGWKNMIAAIGAKALPKNVISDSHLVDDYIETYRQLGKKPKFEEFRRAQRHTTKVLDRAFGRPGWSNLKFAAQRKMRKL